MTTIYAGQMLFITGTVSPSGTPVEVVIRDANSTTDVGYSVPATVVGTTWSASLPAPAAPGNYRTQCRTIPVGSNGPVTTAILDNLASFSVVLKATPVTQRDPTTTDDTNAGYSVGNLWRNLANRKTWKCTANTGGAATWQDVTSGVLPLDVLTANSVTAIAAYGTKKLASAYAGKALSVLRDLDLTTQDIGFVSGGTAFDTASFNSFIGTTAPQLPWSLAGLGSVATAYDQSGNGNHATQSNASYMPRIAAGQLIGDSPSMLMVGPQEAGRTYGFLNLPAGVAANSNQAASVAMVARNTHVTAQQNLMTWAGTNALTMLSSWGGYVNHYDSGASFGAAKVFSGRLGPVNSDIYMMVAASTAAASSFTQGGTTVQGGLATAGALAGGFLGATGTGSPPSARGATEQSCAIFVASALSPAVQLALQISLIELFDMTPQVRNLIVMSGDSFLGGQYSTNLRSEPRILSTMLAVPAVIINTGLPGDSLTGRVSKFSLLQQIALGQLTGGKKLYYEEAGTNDLANSSAWASNTSVAAGAYRNVNGLVYLCTTAGTTSATSLGPTGTGTGIQDGSAQWSYVDQVATMTSNMTSLVSSARSAGATGVVIRNVSPRGGYDAWQEAQRLNYNTNIRANAMGADYVYDAANDRYLGSFAELGQRNYFYSDTTHMVDPGWTRDMGRAAGYLNALLIA